MQIKTMSKSDREVWTAKTERMNADHEIAVGDRVRDFLLRDGVVTCIEQKNSENQLEEHGTVEVLLEDGESEHFTHTAWQKQLRRLPPDDASQRENPSTM